MFASINWPSIIAGGLFGAVISPVLILFINAILSTLPVNFRQKSSYHYRRLRFPRDPFWINTSVRDGLRNIIRFSESRIFIIRLGNLHMNHQTYSERVQEIIEVDHIWDWHFFVENEISGQSKNEWMKDFYKLNKEAKVPSVWDDISTTELGIILGPVDLNLSAHSRCPIDMIFHG